MMLLAAMIASLAEAGPGRDPVVSRSSPWQFEARMGLFGSRRVERRVFFYPSGRMEFDDGESGSWDCSNDCVSWATKTGDETRQYHANLYQNQFGRAPRMFCGVITRDRRHQSTLFRPVLGSFKSVGTSSNQLY